MLRSFGSASCFNRLRNAGVTGSSPVGGTILPKAHKRGTPGSVRWKGVRVGSGLGVGRCGEEVGVDPLYNPLANGRRSPPLQSQFADHSCPQPSQWRLRRTLPMMRTRCRRSCEGRPAIAVTTGDPGSLHLTAGISSSFGKCGLIGPMCGYNKTVSQ
jgi:hypothetical protein